MVAAKPLGVIDALAGGFTVMHRRLALLLIPVLVDLWFWLGPRLIAAPLLTTLLNSGSGLAWPAPMASGNFDPMNLNLMLLLSLRLPSLIQTTMFVPTPVLSPWLRPQIELATWPQFLAAVLGLATLGLVLASLYLGTLADTMRSEGWTFAGSLVRLGRRVRALAGVLAILLGLTTSAAGAALLLSRQPALALVAVLVQGAAVFLGMVFFFVDAAIFVGDLGALAALRQSVRLVWRQFWPCLGIFLSVQVIGIGLPLFWSALPGHLLSQPWGTPLAMVAHLYLLTGLTAGVMGFYRSRIALLGVVRA